MQPNTAKKYLAPLNQITEEFLLRMEEKIKSDNELECDFMEELYKWALECKYLSPARLLYLFKQCVWKAIIMNDNQVIHSDLYVFYIAKLE